MSTAYPKSFAHEQDGNRVLGDVLLRTVRRTLRVVPTFLWVLGEQRILH